jgi:telomerase Cajal body protein 1
LIDAYTGKIRASYRPINALDELEAPTCLLFSRSRQSFYCAGFRTDRFIHYFDINHPGRDSTVLRMGKTRRSRDGQKGMISAMAESSPASTGGHLLAVGTYSPGSIYVYDIRTHMETNSIPSGKCLVGHGAKWLKQRHNNNCNEEQEGDNWLSKAKIKWFQSKTQTGVTQLQFSDVEPHLLYSTSRRSNAVIAWDMRMWRGSKSYEVCSGSTNQRIGFDLAGHRLLVGGVDGQVRIYNTITSDLEHRWVVNNNETTQHCPVVNGVSTTCINDHTSYVAISCGSRQFPSVEELENDEQLTVTVESGGLLLYKLSKASSAAPEQSETNATRVGDRSETASDGPLPVVETENIYQK